MEFEILPFEMKDYDEVYQLWQSCEGIGLSEADSPERIQSYLARNPGCSFVARKNGQIVGAVLGGSDGRRGYLHHLAVHPSVRRLGIGSRLTQMALQALGRQGIDRVHIFVYADNRVGIAFWERMGWRLRSNLVLMSIDLPQPF
ncbi:MAG: GNAT family N-acetyltransferase [Chloroflexota bacterium]